MIDIQDLHDQFDAIENDANAVAAGLPEELGTWRERPDSWSVAECIDHLATGNTVYLAAMNEGASRARERGRLRRKPARPGLIGSWFVRYLEPPLRVVFKMKAPRKIVPRKSPPLADALQRFLDNHRLFKAYLTQNADLDLAGARFANPFIPGVRFSLATGLWVVVAHDRRHLWQAWRVRNAAAGASGGLM